MQANAYKLTTLSCFTGIFVQAIITNLTAILFIPLMRIYDLSYIHLGALVAVNFSVQVGSDVVFSGLIDRIGFRRLVLPSCLLAFAGLALFALAPALLFFLSGRNTKTFSKDRLSRVAYGCGDHWSRRVGAAIIS